jgi:hypothetical protein
MRRFVDELFSLVEKIDGLEKQKDFLQSSSWEKKLIKLAAFRAKLAFMFCCQFYTYGLIDLGIFILVYNIYKIYIFI